MIQLTISSLIFYYTLFSVVVMLIIWLVYGYKGTKRIVPKDIDLIWKCTVCSNTYIDSKHDDISVCPLCGSYNKKELKKGVEG